MNRIDTELQRAQAQRARDLDKMGEPNRLVLSPRSGKMPLGVIDDLLAISRPYPPHSISGAAKRELQAEIEALRS